MDVDLRLDPGHWTLEAESTESRLVRDLTLMLMYLTSWHDGLGGEIRRCWKTFTPEIIHELVGNGRVQTRPENKTLAFTESGEEEAQLLLNRYGFESPNGSPLTLREIRRAVSQLPNVEREGLIRDLLNSELVRAEGKGEASNPLPGDTGQEELVEIDGADW